jgi:hypothetical protein
LVGFFIPDNYVNKERENTFDIKEMVYLNMFIIEEKEKMKKTIGKRQILKYYHRFGQIALHKGFVNKTQLSEAFNEQINNIPFINRLRPHRFIGEIFLEKGWMTLKQIEIVLNEILNDGEKRKGSQ